MKLDLESFIAERAEHLAMVYLTRSQDLVVERMKADYGLDMLVTILCEKFPTGRVFGIQAQGRDKAFKNIQQEALLALSVKENSYFQDLPFPVGLLFFTMEDDKGYFKWLKYPSGSNKNHHSLEHNQWRSLDEYQVDRILEEVNAWYEEKSHSVA
ncbi:MAG: DUF4365 domain-containing protein [Cyanosarcina radialis HA8281-LM2]|jgi:hypothetical protein|nr:DUF4365 domain-containing protein [Cyanosarcina radialis HA8281-LM2]